MYKPCLNYRKLCSYDEFTNACGTPIAPLGQVSFECVNNGYGNNSRQCVRKDRPPGPGSFSNMQECAKQCGSVTPIPSLGNYSYKCTAGGTDSSGVKSCVRKQHPPDGNEYFRDMQECKIACSGGLPANPISYKCAGGSGSSGLTKRCIQQNMMPDGRDYYSTMQECNLTCGGGLPANPISYKCTGGSGTSGVTKRCVQQNMMPDGRDYYSTMQECNSKCANPKSSGMYSRALSVGLS